MKTGNHIICILIGMIFSALSCFSAFAEQVPVEDLEAKWNFYGIGSSKVERGMFYMKEARDSQGVMLVSPEAYDEDITVKYEIMPMSPASVCVVILSASDAGDGASLTLPAGYDGAMGHWIDNVHNYFFAFHNAAHNTTPFAIRFPEKKRIVQHEENVVRAGAFYSIEVGRQDEKLWLKVNGELVFEGRDEKPLGAGHIAFRLRGLSEEPAACLIREVAIERPESESPPDSEK